MPTMVVDPLGRQVPWIGQGHPRETARAFLQQLSAGVAERIKAVAIDMTTAYGLEIKTHCPQAEIVYDLLHVVAKYGRKVIDRGARRHEEQETEDAERYAFGQMPASRKMLIHQ